jgi:hypothetical protein
LPKLSKGSWNLILAVTKNNQLYLKHNFSIITVKKTAPFHPSSFLNSCLDMDFWSEIQTALSVFNTNNANQSCYHWLIVKNYIWYGQTDVNTTTCILSYMHMLFTETHIYISYYRRQIHNICLKSKQKFYLKKNICKERITKSCFPLNSGKDKIILQK